LRQNPSRTSRINGHPYIRRTPTGEPVPQVTAPDGLRQILKQLRIVTGVDFELYKPAMIGRRIARRMALHRIDTHQQYLDLIRKDRPELRALYEVRDRLLPRPGKPPGRAARVFFNLVPGNTGNKGPRTIRRIPGCSSGEEVYSLAMLLFEQLGERRTEVAVQIFGTDISERSVQRAPAGIYPPSAMLDVSSERQRRFFSRTDGNF
jgi:two-component system CheB/CheR fusion protein